MEIIVFKNNLLLVLRLAGCVRGLKNLQRFCMALLDGFHELHLER